MYQQLTLTTDATINQNDSQGPKKTPAMCRRFDKESFGYLLDVIHSGCLANPRQLLEIIRKCFGRTFGIKNRHWCI